MSSVNPFESPNMSANVTTSEPVSARPIGITVFGIISIIFGVLGTFGGCCGGLFLFVPQDPAMAGANPVIDMMNESTGYAVFNYVSMGLGLIMSILLIAIGIGLLRMSKIARPGAIAYGVYGIVSGIVVNAVNIFLVFLPAINSAAPDSAEHIAGMMALIFGAIGGVIGLIFPIALLIYFLRPPVKGYFENWNGT